MKNWFIKCISNWRNTSRFQKRLIFAFLLMVSPIVIAEYSQWFYGFVEGVSGLDLTLAQSGRCRLENPLATVKVGGEILHFGSVNVPKRGVQDHVWGYDTKGAVVDLVCPDTVAACRETRKNVFSELRIASCSAVVLKGSEDPRVPAYVERLNGILAGQRLVGLI